MNRGDWFGSEYQGLATSIGHAGTSLFCMPTSTVALNFHHGLFELYVNVSRNSTGKCVVLQRIKSVIKSAAWRCWHAVIRGIRGVAHRFALVLFSSCPLLEDVLQISQLRHIFASSLQLGYLFLRFHLQSGLHCLHF